MPTPTPRDLLMFATVQVVQNTLNDAACINELFATVQVVQNLGLDVRKQVGPFATVQVVQNRIELPGRAKR